MIWQYLITYYYYLWWTPWNSKTWYVISSFLQGKREVHMELGLYHFFRSLLVTSTFFFDLIKQAECWQKGDLYKVTQHCSMWVLMGMNLHILPFHKTCKFRSRHIMYSKKQQIYKMAKSLVVKLSTKENLLFHNLSLWFLFQDLVHLWGKACGQILK